MRNIKHKCLTEGLQNFVGVAAISQPTIYYIEHRGTKLGSFSEFKVKMMKAYLKANGDIQTMPINHFYTADCYLMSKEWK